MALCVFLSLIFMGFCVRGIINTGIATWNFAHKEKITGQVIDKKISYNRRSNVYYITIKSVYPIFEEAISHDDWLNISIGDTVLVVKNQLMSKFGLIRKQRNLVTLLGFLIFSVTCVWFFYKRLKNIEIKSPNILLGMVMLSIYLSYFDILREDLVIAFKNKQYVLILSFPTLLLTTMTIAVIYNLIKKEKDSNE